MKFHASVALQERTAQHFHRVLLSCLLKFNCKEMRTLVPEPKVGSNSKLSAHAWELQVLFLLRPRVNLPEFSPNLCFWPKSGYQIISQTLLMWTQSSSLTALLFCTLESPSQ